MFIYDNPVECLIDLDNVISFYWKCTFIGIKVLLSFIIKISIICQILSFVGYGNTPAIEIPDRGIFLHNVIQAFDLKYPVIVSPSMSGYFALPYLLKHWKNIAGYIPVAPVGIEVLEELPPLKNPEIKRQVYKPLQEFLYDPLPDLNHVQVSHW